LSNYVKLTGGILSQKLRKRNVGQNASARKKMVGESKEKAYENVIEKESLLGNLC